MYCGDDPINGTDPSGLDVWGSEDYTSSYYHYNNPQRKPPVMRGEIYGGKSNGKSYDAAGVLHNPKVSVYVKNGIRTTGSSYGAAIRTWWKIYKARRAARIAKEKQEAAKRRQQVLDMRLRAGLARDARFLGDFVFGDTFGPNEADRVYFWNDPETVDMRSSVGVEYARLKQTMGEDKGHVRWGTFLGAAETLYIRPGNATQMQVGGYDVYWNTKRSVVYYKVKNTADMDSLLYHLPKTTELNHNRSQYPYGGTMTQTFVWCEASNDR